MSAGNRKGRPPEHDWPSVITAAKAVVAQRGIDNLRFVDVAVASGVPVSSLQYAFGSRDELVREVLRSAVGDEFDRLRRAVDRPSDPWHKVLAFIDNSISTDEQRRREGWLLWIEYWRAGLRDQRLRLEYVPLARSWRALLVGPIREGVVLGKFTVASSATQAAAAIVGLVDGLGLQVEVGDLQMSARRARNIAKSSARQLLGVS